MRKTDQAHDARIRAAGRAKPGGGQSLITVLTGLGAREFSISS
ncbi:hypothetical protein [Bradyrhizobium sp. CER78]|nr:hypothetical protein [Bradyrhizobium sp. CER78]MDH2384067.1 hypothetical protein [Bradyrhizobium sp. CER78]